MGLQHIPQETRHDGGWVSRAFNNTWGHLAPKKNTSYKGVVRFTVTDHSHYGSQPIILQYEFPNLEGPYLHDKLFDDVFDWKIKGAEFEAGAIYQRELTFRNYRWYYGKITKVFTSLELKYENTTD